MNPEQEVLRLLDEVGAVLVRQNKHLVYRLPNGRNFVLAKTSSDPARAAQNSLSDLRRALGVRRETAIEKEKPVEEHRSGAVAPVAALESALHQSRPTSADSDALQQRIEEAIKVEEAQQEKLLAEAQQVERRVQMLRSLLPFAADATTEGVLKGLFPPPMVPANAPAPATSPEPPQQITERVQVTRQLVFAAAQTFEDTFTVNDVMDRMTGGAVIDRAERLRVRSSIAQSIVTLYQRGEVIRVEEGLGKRQTIWKKADLKGADNSKGSRR